MNDYMTKEIPLVNIKTWEVNNSMSIQTPIGNNVYIDEFMIPIIIKLNKKGYKTEHCCSGHVFDDYKCGDSYISFVYNYFYEQTLLPKHFHFDKVFNYHTNQFSDNNNYRVIRCDYYNKYKDIGYRQKCIMRMLLDLIKWVDKLPDLTQMKGYYNDKK